MNTDCKSLSSLLPRTTGLLADGIERGEHLGGQISVRLDGRTLVDAGFGESHPGREVSRDDLALWMSCTKPVSAAALLWLADAGAVLLDDPVARHVPEFGQKGKEAVTLRHLLTHTGGFRSADLGWKPRPWAEAVQQVCEAPLEPRWEPGKTAGYHVDSSWYMLGEVVRRVSRADFGAFVRERVFAPLGMDDCFLGLPEAGFADLEPRLIRFYNTQRVPPHEHRMFREPPVAFLCRPGGGGRGPARAWARFMDALLRPETQSVLRPETILDMRRRHRSGLPDKSFRRVIDWGLGVIVNSAMHNHGPVPYGFGPHASADAFGHGGNQSSSILADPAHGLAAGLFLNGQPGEATHLARMHELLGALYEDLGLARST